jgi:hypothetical protein
MNWLQKRLVGSQQGQKLFNESSRRSLSWQQLYRERLERPAALNNCLMKAGRHRLHSGRSFAVPTGSIEVRQIACELRF